VKNSQHDHEQRHDDQHRARAETHARFCAGFTRFCESCVGVVSQAPASEKAKLSEMMERNYAREEMHVGEYTYCFRR
jgi:hypothetical protein